jgi:hypothetical protein
MPLDRSIRFLSALGGASTSRVLNLSRIAADNADNPDHARRPLFLSPVINRGFLVKHRVRSDEAYLFNAPRTVATKLILPFDHGDLRAGGRSLFVDQRGFEEALCSTGNYKPRALDRDLGVIRLVAAVPSLDPFLLREHLRNNGIDVAPCYFTISPGDQERMHDFVSREVSQLIELAGGNGEHDIGRMVSALAEKALASGTYKGEAKNAREFIHESIVHPSAYLEPGEMYSAGGTSFMPDTYGTSLTPEQVDQLVDYLSTLK